MPQTVEVRFKGIRRDFFLWPDDQEPLRLHEAVVVSCQRGQDLGRVQSANGAAEKKCGSCSSCAVGVGVAEGRAGGQLIDDAVTSQRGDAMAGEAPEAASPVENLEESDTPDPVAEAPVETSAAEPPSGQAAGASAEAPTRQAPDLRLVVRRATQEDLRIANDLRRSEEEGRRVAMEKVRQHRLDMKVSDAEWQWDKTKLTLYFTAEKRVDFRALVRDLAAVFRTRIELRQIGVRDEAARLGGVGRCGRAYCCSTWLTELSPVSLALAKDQHLSLNPAQISGGCGRLLCCLKYEHEFYVAARKRFPREGKTVVAGRGPEKVVAVDIFRERVFLRNEEGSRIIPLVQLREEMEDADSAARQLGGAVARPPSAPGNQPSSGANVEKTATTGEPAAPPNRRGRERPAPSRDRTGLKGTPPAAAVPGGRSVAEPPTGEASPRRKRRRRRGRRGQGGNPGGPPTSSPPGS